MAKPEFFGQVRNAYRLRWMRRRRIYDAFRSRHQLTKIHNKTDNIQPDDVLLFATMRNEILRLPHFMAHYRSLGIRHFLVVDNQSDDGTGAYLESQADVSLWSTPDSYRNSRFGADWLGWLRMKYAHGHWCLTVDADEILIYPNWKKNGINQIVERLDSNQTPAMGALMVDLFPRGRLDADTYVAGQDPFELLNWFDAQPHSIQRQEPMGNLWVQGGVRAREIFVDHPKKAPTLNKLPLVKWDRRYAYVNSTHAILPADLNQAYDGPGGIRFSGILLHTKFLPTIGVKSAEEKVRRQHFSRPTEFNDYHDRLISGESLWNENATEFLGWQQLVSLGLMSDGD